MPVNQKPYYPVVLSILKERGASLVLDAPCGTGWLGLALQQHASDITLDGVGLWEFPAKDGGYRNVAEYDLDNPLPEPAQRYDAVTCCEAIHLITNPGVVLSSFARSLRPGGTVIITTPNTWSLRSRLRFLSHGFFPGFRPAIDKKFGEDYITYFPWTFPQMHLLLSHYGYSNITLHEVDEPKPRYVLERLLALPSQMYYRSLRRRAKSRETAEYWDQARSAQSVHGRWLVVSATHSGQPS